MADRATMRILDASLNRAGEGLRVVEDFVRFVLDDPFLTGQIKSLRHDFWTSSLAIAMAERHAARDTSSDVGTAISHEGENRRGDAWAVCAASLKRAEQSFRSLEEYGKLVDAAFASGIESLRYRLYTLEKAIDIGRSSRERLREVRLCVLADGGNSAEDFERLIRELVAADVAMIQLRDKRLSDRALVARARQLRQLTLGTQSLAIINDRADIAAAVNADGVHLGQEDLTVKDARAAVGSRMLVGISTHDIHQAREAVLDGANYLGAGPTFSSQTKAFEHFAGVAYLREVSAEVRLPTFAIGGITDRNLPVVLATGIQRVAVGAAVTAAQEPGSAAGELLAMLKSATAVAAEAARPHQRTTSGPKL
jgi:thiamine-phosphate pyrophosphorylase